MKKLFKENLYFIIPLFIFLLLFSILIIILKKEESILLLNQNIHPDLDFLKYLTHLGGSLFWIITIIIFSFVQLKKSIIILVSGIISSLITQSIKIITEYNYRPYKYFKENNLDISELFLVEGVNIESSNSFPSGHSTMAFCLFFTISLFLKNKYLKFICFIIAFIVGFSRIYLYYHFLEDVVMGAFIGSACSFFIYIFLINTKYLQNPSFEKNILNFRN